MPSQHRFTPIAPAARRLTAGRRTAAAVTVATAVVLLVTSSCSTGQRQSPSSGRRPPGAATVTRVIDGDTIEVRLAGRLERVRLLGIDTPESVKPGTPPECFSHQASAATTGYLPKGTPVDLVRDVEARDDYGRLLAYVYRERDHSFVNLWLVEQGFAGLLTYPPNVAHAPQLQLATSQAKGAGRGLWSTCGAVHSRR